MKANHSKNKAEAEAEGILYVVATPIGNLDDITFRAVKILESVDFIAAEDTRNTSRLLSHLGISSRLVSCHDHNENIRADFIIDEIRSGKNVALVSDAGTPLVSDPGYRVVEAAASKGIRIVPVPGASSVLAALSASGLPVDKFLFMGFPPRQKGKRRSFLEEASRLSFTTIYFESPHRILDFLKDAMEVLGDRNAVLAREITKTYEEFIRGKISDLMESLLDMESIRGEFVLIVEGESIQNESMSVDEADLDSEIKRLLDEGAKTSGIAKLLSDRFGMNRQEVYQKVLEIKDGL